MGYRAASGKIVVGANRGASHQDRAAETRRAEMGLGELVGGTPWRTTPEHDKEDDEGFMPDIVINMEVPAAEQIERPEVRDAGAVPRRVYLRRKAFEVCGCIHP